MRSLKFNWIFVIVFVSLYLNSLALSANEVAPKSAVISRKEVFKKMTKECPNMTQEETTNLEMVGKVLNDKKPYAALALIDSLNINAPQLDLLKANSMRQTGKLANAKVIYSSLTETCVSAYAYQGLGWISNQYNNNKESLNFMKMAAMQMPISSAIRSDHGFSLMQVGDYEQAFDEYLTAIELDDSNKRAKYNLIFLLYKTNQKEKAKQFARIYEVTDLELEKISADANVKTISSVNNNANVQAKISRFNSNNEQCVNASEICSGILSTKLEGYTYE